MIRMKVWMLAVSLSFSALACASPAAPGPAGDGGQGMPKPGGTLNMRAQDDPTDWDLSYQGKTNILYSARAWETLLTFKAGPDVAFGDFVLRPLLAERWEVSPDARSFTYYLRKNVKWANMPPINGRELTAADVKWSFDYWAREGEFKEKKLPSGEFSWMFEGVQAIETPDPYTVAIRFKDPYVPFTNYAANEHIPVVPREIYEQDGHFKDRVVGSGPFQLDVGASQKGTRWVWRKNPDYWDNGKPFLDEVRVLTLKEDATAYTAFHAGRLDLLDWDISLVQGKEVLQREPSAVPHLYNEVAGLEIYMNPRMAPYTDVRVRKAINLAIDRDEFVRSRTDGKGSPALAGAPIGTFTQDEVKKMLPYDPEEAKQLLREAGYPAGVDAPFLHRAEGSDDLLVDAQLLQAQLKKAGINLVIKPVPQVEMSALRRRREHSMELVGRGFGGDIDYQLYRIFHPKSGNAYDAIDDARLVQLLEAQRKETDPEKRQQVVRDAVRYINLDIAIGRALYYGAYYQFSKPYVRNFAPHRGHRSSYVTETWLDK